MRDTRFEAPTGKLAMARELTQLLRRNPTGGKVCPSSRVSASACASSGPPTRRLSIRRSAFPTSLSRCGHRRRRSMRSSDSSSGPTSKRGLGQYICLRRRAWGPDGHRRPLRAAAAAAALLPSRIGLFPSPDVVGHGRVLRGRTADPRVLVRCTWRATHRNARLGRESARERGAPQDRREERRTSARGLRSRRTIRRSVLVGDRQQRVGATTAPGQRDVHGDRPAAAAIWPERCPRPTSARLSTSPSSSSAACWCLPPPSAN